MNDIKLCKKEEKTIYEDEGYILIGIEIEQKTKISARNDYGVKFESIWVRREAIPALIAYLLSGVIMATNPHAPAPSVPPSPPMKAKA